MEGAARAAMRVFLRFIYAGYVHPSDWDVTEEVTASSNVETVAVLRSRCMEHDLENLGLG